MPHGLHDHARMLAVQHQRRPESLSQPVQVQPPTSSDKDFVLPLVTPTASSPGSMAHDVFISHSSKDKLTADAVCAALEAQGVRCWVAPRDILPGRNWGGSIVEAIKGARVMVLIFSAHANNSEHIKREVERAANRNIPIIPMRIEDVVPTDAFEYFLSSPHWLDAFPPPLENHLQHLAKTVRQIVALTPVESAAARQPPGAASDRLEAPKAEEAKVPPVSPATVRADGCDKAEAPGTAPGGTSPLRAPKVGAPAPENTGAPRTALAETVPVSVPGLGSVAPREAKAVEKPSRRPDNARLPWLAMAAVLCVLMAGLGGLYSYFHRPPVSDSAAPTEQPGTTQQKITLTAHADVRVKLVQKLDGAEVFQGTLAKGEIRSFPKRGALLLTASALENVDIEIDGRRQVNPFSGYSRLEIP